MLTNKTKIDFEKWLKTQDDFRLNNHTKQIIFKGCFTFSDLPNFIKETMYLIWFDSIGIYINALSYGNHWKPVCNNSLDIKLSNRTEAIRSAIEQANRLYNQS